MGSSAKPPTLRTSRLKEQLRIFLSGYLRDIPRHERTLDLGCGWGFSFRINPGFYGIDIDDECVRYCRQQGYKVVKGNLLDPLPFRDGFFDNVFTHDVLEHFELEEVSVIFRNVRSVLRSGGIFMNVIPNRKGYEFGLRINAGHKHFIVPEEIEYVATREGYKFVRCYSAPVPQFLNELFTHAKYVTYCQKI